MQYIHFWCMIIDIGNLNFSGEVSFTGKYFPGKMVQIWELIAISVLNHKESESLP